MRGKCKLRETESEGDGVKGDDGGERKEKRTNLKNCMDTWTDGGGINILNCNAITDISIIGLV